MGFFLRHIKVRLFVVVAESEKNEGIKREEKSIRNNVTFL
jgi:hypothetical protein